MYYDYISIQDDIPHDSLKYYYGPISLHDKAMGGFALVNVDESTLTVTFIDYKGITLYFIMAINESLSLSLSLSFPMIR